MKRLPVVVAVLVFALLLPLILVGTLFAIAGEELIPSELALREIPSDLFPLYRAAAATCPGLDWTILAAIHRVETNFGRGSVTSSAGAQGPMQFMPATFDSYGIDGDGNGVVEINDVEDAVFSAANLLCANRAGDPAHLATALWNYNHSQAYVDEVLTLATSYGVLSVGYGVGAAPAADLLRNPRVTLTPHAKVDLKAGIVDERLVSLLSWIAQRHSITITVFKTGHSRYTRSGSVSNHYFGRAADIFIVDGEPVSPWSEAARKVVLEGAGMRGPLRPQELGHPFGAIGFPGGFTDADHRDHIHIGFE